jgi:hypothetical protein
VIADFRNDNGASIPGVRKPRSISRQMGLLAKVIVAIDGGKLQSESQVEMQCPAEVVAQTTFESEAFSRLQSRIASLECYDFCQDPFW